MDLQSNAFMLSVFISFVRIVILSFRIQCVHSTCFEPIINACFYTAFFCLWCLVIFLWSLTFSFECVKMLYLYIYIYIYSAFFVVLVVVAVVDIQDFLYEIMWQDWIRLFWLEVIKRNHFSLSDIFVVIVIVIVMNEFNRMNCENEKVKHKEQLNTPCIFTSKVSH